MPAFGLTSKSLWSSILRTPRSLSTSAIRLRARCVHRAHIPWIQSNSPVKTGAYRIDMVIEGVGDVRLAIECDGDEFHGPDRWAHDMNQQRVLERVGWVFWRCFAPT